LTLKNYFNKVNISLVKFSEAFDLYRLGFKIIHNLRFIFTSSILTQFKRFNSNSFVMAETETKAAPKLD